MIEAIGKVMTAVKQDLKSRWDFYTHAAYLRKMGWTEEAYQRQNDPDVNYRADRLAYFYHGYPHVYVFTTSTCDPFTRFESWTEAYNKIDQWCKEQCKGKTRNDILRVYKQTGLTGTHNGVDWIEEPEWFISDVGGGDALIFAFQEDKDYSHFLLKWT